VHNAKDLSALALFMQPRVLRLGGSTPVLDDEDNAPDRPQLSLTPARSDAAQRRARYRFQGRQ
jgi:hypothetical protein